MSDAELLLRYVDGPSDPKRVSRFRIYLLNHNDFLRHPQELAGRCIHTLELTDVVRE